MTTRRTQRRWVRRASSIFLAVGLVATACTSSDSTETLTNANDQQTTSTSTTIDRPIQSDGQTNAQQSNELTAVERASSNSSSEDGSNSAVEPSFDDPYWTNASSTTTTQPPKSSVTTAAKQQEKSLGTQPKQLGFADKDYTVPEKSYVATVTGEGVSSLPTAAPGPAEHWFPNPTQFGNERVFLVLDDTTSADYIKVSLPVRPNGQEGWIPRDTVTISEVQHFAVVDLGTDSLTVWDGDDVIVQTKAVTGRPSRPTPVGNFFIRDIIKHDNPGGAYGPYIIALSAFSEVLETFAGGLPAVAIHGTNKPWLVGGEHSSGCIRIPNDLIQLLAASVPPGTPVTITA